MKKQFFCALGICLAMPAMVFGDFVVNFGGVADIDAGDGTNPAGVSVLSSVVTIDETITGITFVLEDAVHDWIGDLQVTLSNGTNQVIVFGLQDGLTFDGTNGQAGNVGVGGFGSSAHLSGDPDSAPATLDYTFADGGADFDAAGEGADGAGLIDAATIYAATAENSGDVDAGTIQSFLTAFAGSTAGTWTVSVVDTFATGDNGSIGNISLAFTTAAIPEPASMAFLALGGLGLAVRRKR